MYRLAVKYERCLKDVVFNFTEITQRYELYARGGGGMINLFIEKNRLNNFSISLSLTNK